MSKKILAVSWLQGRFHAAALHGVEMGASWASPQPVSKDGDFGPALAEAVRQTRFKGNQVMIVLDHGSLIFHVEETPPSKGKLLRQVIERRVKQNRFFDEPAAWGRIDLPELKGRHRVLLALAPQSLLRQLAAACAELRLELVAVMPLAVLLGHRLRGLSVPAEETVVLATHLGGSLHLLLGRGDGQVLFSRTVLLGATVQSDRAAQEIARTLHYAQQQFGITVNQLFVFGTEAFHALEGAQIRAGLKVQSGQATDDPFYFARQAGRVAYKTPVNLVSRAESRQRRTRELAAAGLAACLALTAMATLVVERAVRARERTATARGQEFEAAAQADAAYHARQREARRLDAFVRLVGGTNDAPIAELFARYLPTVTPETIHFTEAGVNRGLGGWEFHLNGFIREPGVDFLAALERFEQQLQSGPLRVEITDSTRQQLFQGNTDEAAPAIRRSGRPGDEKPFFVKGRIP